MHCGAWVSPAGHGTALPWSGDASLTGRDSPISPDSGLLVAGRSALLVFALTEFVYRHTFTTRALSSAEPTRAIDWVALRRAVQEGGRCRANVVEHGPTGRRIA